jgi:hypothetical protein
MDKLNSYREIIQNVVKEYAKYKPSHGKIEAIPICDVENNNYLLMGVGWDKTGRVHDVVLHLRIKDGKIWVEWDGIEQGITQDLLEAGVLEEDIMLEFYRSTLPNAAITTLVLTKAFERNAEESVTKNASDQRDKLMQLLQSKFLDIAMKIETAEEKPLDYNQIFQISLEVEKAAEADSEVAEAVQAVADFINKQPFLSGHFTKSLMYTAYLEHTV